MHASETRVRRWGQVPEHLVQTSTCWTRSRPSTDCTCVSERVMHPKVRHLSTLSSGPGRIEERCGGRIQHIHTLNSNIGAMADSSAQVHWRSSALVPLSPCPPTQESDALVWRVWREHHITAAQPTQTNTATWATRCSIIGATWILTDMAAPHLSSRGLGTYIPKQEGGNQNH